MQFTLKTLLLLFVVLASSVGAFGLWGIFLTILVVPFGFLFKTQKNVGNKVMCVVTFFGALGGILFFLMPFARAAREYSWDCDGPPRCPPMLGVIGNALHEYHDAYGSFPPACVTDGRGKPMHSWRTLILQYCDRHTYQSYDFKQPWDAPANAALIAATDLGMCCPGRESHDLSRTDYFAVIGPGTAWPGDHGRKLDEFTDELDQTILLVEATDRDVPWGEPCDITVDEALGVPGGSITTPRSNHLVNHATFLYYFFKSRPIAGYALLASGRVMEIPERISREDLAALLSINGGEKIDLRAMLKRYEPPLVESLRWDHVVGLPLFLVSVVWFWLRLAADAKVARETPKTQLA